MNLVIWSSSHLVISETMRLFDTGSAEGAREDCAQLDGFLSESDRIS